MNNKQKAAQILEAFEENQRAKKVKKFTIFFLFVSWTDISLGISLDIKAPKIQLHIPFGFVSVGWETVTAKPLNWYQLTNVHYLVGEPEWRSNV